MKRLIIICVVTILIYLLIPHATFAAPITFIDDSTLGFYNDSLGAVLDRTNPFHGTFLFPGANISDGDPVINPAPEPDLSVADSILEPWLDNPQTLINWSSPQLIPSTWTRNTETAIIYQIDAGTSGIQDVIANIGVDNGVFVWLDGLYQFGALAPGLCCSAGFEYSALLPDMEPGTHYLQILREDHGIATGFTIQVTGVPEPATVLLLGFGSLVLVRRRRKQS